MGFSFKKIGEKLVEGDFEYEGQTLHVTVDANALTASKLKTLNQDMAKEVTVKTGLEQQAAESQGMALMLSMLIRKWDAADGQPTFEFLAGQPLDFLNRLLEFATELAFPKKAT